LLVVCSGTYEQAAYEDVLGAGALCDSLWPGNARTAVADSALMSRALYRLEQGDLTGGLSRSRNGRRLLARSELREDIAFCSQHDAFDLVAQMDQDGFIKTAQAPKE
jgi:phosphosulfolactate phosphohydrolase-like enzyme